MNNSLDSFYNVDLSVNENEESVFTVELTGELKSAIDDGTNTSFWVQGTQLPDFQEAIQEFILKFPKKKKAPPEDLPINISYMFAGCNNLQTLDIISNWNLKNVYNLSGMFFECFNLNDVSAIVNWNTSSVLFMEEMFSSCQALVDVSSLAPWDISSVINMSSMFSDCNLLEVLPKWKPKNLHFSSAMFYSCVSLVDIKPLAKWSCKKLVDCSDMFGGCESLVDMTVLEKWELKDCIMYNMFVDCKSKQYPSWFSEDSGPCII